MAQSIFDAAMAQLMIYIPTMVANANTVEANVVAKSANADTKSAAADASAVAALDSQIAAATSANLAATSAGATLWTNTGATYAINDLKRSGNNGRIYRRLTASNAGVTDPSVDAANWAIYTIEPLWSLPKTANYTAISGDAIQANTTGGTFTITLPATPAFNDVVRVEDYIGTFDTNKLIIARNGSKIMGLAEDMDITTKWASPKFTFIDATVGWKAS